MNIKNSAKFGFGASLGSWAAGAIPGVIVAGGLGLVYAGGKKRSEEGKRNMTLTIIGIILIVLGALPYLPILGITMLPDILSGKFDL